MNLSSLSIALTLYNTNYVTCLCNGSVGPGYMFQPKDCFVFCLCSLYNFW